MATKRKGYGFVRVSVERKLSPRDKRRVTESRPRTVKNSLRQGRSQEEQPWWARPRHGRSAAVRGKVSPSASRLRRRDGRSNLRGPLYRLSRICCAHSRRIRPVTPPTNNVVKNHPAEIKPRPVASRPRAVRRPVILLLQIHDREEDIRRIDQRLEWGIAVWKRLTLGIQPCRRLFEWHTVGGIEIEYHKAD